MKLFRGFAVAGAALAFAVAVLGSWVRINRAGLTCPDWPLCHGSLVPSLGGGVVLEWSHRLVAFALSFVILGTIVTGLRMRTQVPGMLGALAALGTIFTLQVALGGATVFLANSPLSVMLHWAMGMALLATSSVLAVLAVVAPATARTSRRSIGDGAAPALALAACLAFVTMCVGAYVSSSYAGLACPTLPTCGGSLLGTGAAQASQMLHRIAAASFAIAALIATVVALQAGSRRAFAFALTGLVLLCAQIALGVANVVWHLPTALREAHAANAGATFLAFVVAAAVAAIDPLPAPASAGDVARVPRRSAPTA